MKKIEHIAILVKDLDKGVKTYRSLFQIDPLITKVPSEKVSVAIFRLENIKVELVCPERDNRPLQERLKSHGEGLHHIAVGTNNFEQEKLRLSKEGIEIVKSETDVGAEGKRVCFFHPKKLHGVLTELLED